jgi:hypothetical protein
MERKALLWDVNTGKRISLPNLFVFDAEDPMRHFLVGTPLRSGFEIWDITNSLAAGNKTKARVLAELAEAVSGLTISEDGSFQRIENPSKQFEELRAYVGGSRPHIDPLADFIRRILHMTN